MRNGRRAWLLVIAVAFVASLVDAGAGGSGIVNLAGWPQLRAFLRAAAAPVLSADFLRITLDATLTTLSYAVLGTALATAIGVVGGVLTSQTWWATRTRPQGAGPSRAGRGRARRRQVGAVLGWLGARAALGLPRGVHEAVWALVFVNILGLDPLVAVLGIGIPYGAVTAKVYSELLDEAPQEAMGALRGAGVSRLKAMAYTVGPLAFPDMLSYAFYRFECSIRGAAILGTIGAGGLGFQLALSFQSLQYREMWTIIYALVAVCGLADWWSTSLRRRSSLPYTPLTEATGAPHQVPVLRRDRRLLASAAAALVLVTVALVHLRIDLYSLWSDRVQRLAGDLAASSFPPELTGEALARLARVGLETLEMSVVATVVATLGATGAAFVAAATFTGPDQVRPARAAVGQVGRRVLALAARAVLLVCRAIPPPVGALLLVFVLFPGPLPGALALGVYNFGILGRLMAEVVENLDPRPVRALRSQGAGAAQAFAYGALPRTLPRFAAYGLYRWEVTIRETVVVGLVGAGGLGSLLALQLAAFDYQAVTATLVALVTLTFTADIAGSLLRRTLR